MPEAFGKRVALGTALGGLNLVLGAAVTLLMTPVFLRGLEDLGFGLSGLMVSVFAVLNLLSLGGQEATLYFASLKRGGSHTRALLALYLFATLIGALLLALVGPKIGLGSRLGLKPLEALIFDEALPSAAAFWAAQFMVQWLWALSRAHLKFVAQSVHQAMLTVAAPLLAWIALNQGGGLPGFFSSQALAWALGALVLAIWLFRDLPRPEGELLSASREVLVYARWALVFNLSFVALQSVDRFFVAPLGATALAAYTLASALFQRGVSAFGLLPTLLVPTISRMAEIKDKSRASRAYSLSLRLTALCAASCFLPLAALGFGFLSAWTGNTQRAAEAALPLGILCVAGLIASLSAVTHAVLLGLGRARMVGLTALLGSALGLGASWLGAKRYGLPGAALGAPLGYAAVYISRLALSERRVFGRGLLGLAAEHAMLLLGLALAFKILSLLSPFLAGRGLGWQLAGLALSGSLILGSGLLFDRLWSKLRGREPVLDALKPMFGGASKKP